jgi:hypothetical protein
MTQPGNDRTSKARNSKPGGARRRGGEIVMLAVLVIAGIVFFYKPFGFGASVTSPAAAVRSTSPSVEAESIARARAESATAAANTAGHSSPSASEQAERDAARALPMAAPTLSPTEPFPDTLSLDAAYRMRQQNLCVERAVGVVSSGGQGTGTARVDHAGMAADSLAFDGVARSTTGRAMVWRCTIATNAGSVGRMTFIPSDSVPGLVLQWNPVAVLDDYILRRCIVRAQALFDDKKVLLRASGRRRDDQVRFNGVAEGGGVQMNWGCGVTVHADSIVSLAARIGG